MLLSLQLARENSVPMRLCSLISQELTEAMNRGWGERDAMSFLLLQQERSGIPYVRVPAAEIQAVIDKEGA